jgi:O-antigen ligase
MEARLIEHRKAVIEKAQAFAGMKNSLKMKSRRGAQAEPIKFAEMDGTSKIAVITIMLLAAIMPLIVRYINVPTGPDQMGTVTTVESAADMFSYYKSMILLGAALIIVCISGAWALTTQKSHDFKKLLNPVFIAVGIYLFLLLLSSIFTKYHYTAVHGIGQRYESVFVCLAYFVLFFASWKVCAVPGAAKGIIASVLASCFVLGLIGAFQLFGLDFFMTELGRRLVVGWNSTVKLSSQFEGTNMSYTTLYNPNSVGMYASLMLPLCAASALFAKDKLWMRIMFGACAAVMFLNAIGCSSTGGIAGQGMAVLAFLAVIVASVLKGPKKAGLALLGAIAGTGILVVALAFTYAPLRTRIMSMLEKIATMTEGESPYFFRDARVEGSSAFIVTAAGELEVQYNPAGMIVKGPSGVLEPLSVIEIEAGNGKRASYTAEGVGSFLVETATGAFAFKMNEIALIFSVSESGEAQALSRVMAPVDLAEEAPAIGFKGLEYWATSRGYIWSRSLPLALKYPVIGAGPDAYSLVFPQDDVGGKMRYMGNPYIIVDKPHNMYLQIAVNTGILSLLAFLAMVFLYAKDALAQAAKGLAPGEEHWAFGLRIGIFSGVCGYLGAGLSTDSVVSVAPIFWIALGMGFALNARAKRLRAGGGA